MDVAPKGIYRNYGNKELNKLSAIDQLLLLIENADNIDVRLECIKILGDIEAKNKKVFKLLENLLISDSNEKIRNRAAKTIKKLFLKKAIKPLIFAFQHETSVDCLITITNSLGELNDNRLKSLLIDRINKIKSQKIKRSIKNIFKNKNIENFHGKEIANIVNNYIILDYLQRKFIQFDFKTKNGKLTELDLSNISSHLFNWNILNIVLKFVGSLTTLKKLDLKINKITAVPSSIGSISSLLFLDLSYNKIKDLPESIGYLTSLESLYLRYNDLTSIPNSIGSLKSLKILDLRGNKLKNLPKSIKQLSSLEVLDLFGNQLNKVPESLSALSLLKKLDLGMNNLRDLPNSMKNLTSLNKLGIGSNKFLNKVPDWIYLLPSLKELYLYDNNLKELPESIGSITSLEELNLRNNKLSVLPKSFVNLSLLKKLNLSWNKFKYLPDWIDSLTSLEELNLWGNKLESIPESIASLPSLKLLNLNYNKLNTELPKFLRDLESKGLKIPR
ncbi:MAG: leucine-rich repeat domain-containing protein [Promethearchaeota archaeon]